MRKNFLKIFFLILSEIFFLNTEAQKIESPFNEFSVSVNRTIISGGETESRFGFGLGAYHVPKDDDTDGLIVGFEYNNLSEFKKYVDTHSHFGGNEENVLYTVESITFLVGHRFNMDAGIITFIDAGGYLEVGAGFFPGVLAGIGIEIPIGECRLILKPQFNVTPFIDRGKYDEAIYHSYYRIALGLKIL